MRASAYVRASILVLALAGCKGSVSKGGGDVSNGVGGVSDGTGGGGGNGGSGGATGTTTGTGAACPGSETGLPPSDCTPSASECNAATNSCLAVHEAGGAPQFQLRVTQLDIQAPHALTEAGNPVVNGILYKESLPALPSCGVQGSGLFSWLLAFDLDALTLTTGTAAFSEDPLGAYSFSPAILPGYGQTYSVAPATVPLVLDQGCLFASAPASVNLQIFLTDANNWFLIPLTALRISGALSANHNCVGSYKTSACGMWSGLSFQNGGSVSGLIPLAAADGAIIVSLNKSLCVLLTGHLGFTGGAGSPYLCAETPSAIPPIGDACLETGGPATADCADAMFFNAGFAASGVVISP